MTQQRTLWDHVDENAAAIAEKADERADKQRARKQALKKLRASGHWLTLLRVAHTIPQPFTLNDVSVAVWRTCPEFFGMKGYPYPDNHKVHYILYGEKGLIARGLLVRVHQGLFRVPDEIDWDQFQREAETEPEA